MFHAFRRGKAANAQLHELITELLWLQVNVDFTENLLWMRSADYKEPNRFSRSDKEDHVWLSEEGFDQLRRAWGGMTWT